MKTALIVVGSLVLIVMVAVAIMAKDITSLRPPLQPIPPASRPAPPPVKEKTEPIVSDDDIRKKHADEKAAREAARPKEEEILSITRSLNKPYYYDEIGKYWIRKLDDDQVHNVYRSQAARHLGVIKYPPAIPILIKHILLINSGAGVSDGSDDGYHIAQDTLGKYGNAAVPDIIEAYLDSSDPKRRGFLQGAIASGRTYKVARTYLDGLHAQGDKRVTDKDLELFHGLR